MLTRWFPKNESALDRLVRVVFGLALLSMVFVGPHAAWGWLGVVPLLTGLVGNCPLYRVFGLRTGAPAHS